MVVLFEFCFAPSRLVCLGLSGLTWKMQSEKRDWQGVVAKGPAGGYHRVLWARDSIYGVIRRRKWCC